jgi:hypothetical protein
MYGSETLLRDKGAEYLQHAVPGPESKDSRSRDGHDFDQGMEVVAEVRVTRVLEKNDGLRHAQL